MTASRWLVTLGAVLGAWTLAIAEPPAKPAAVRPAASAARDEPRYIRVVESDKGKTLRLQMAVHEYKPTDADGPRLTVAGAVHIADLPFYQALQAELDTKDVVLFEGVKPPGVGRAEHDLDGATDKARAEATRKRIRLLATLAVAAKKKTGDYPASLDDFAAAGDKRIGWLVESARFDGWGNPLVYTVAAAAPADNGDEPADPDADKAKPAKKRPFDIVSTGADGKPGGEGVNADLAFSAQKPLSRDEVPGGDGLQDQLAKAMGLVFQLNVMDHSKPNWRNSDMSIDQVQKRLDAAGAEGSALFQMLDGSSFTAQMASLLLKFIGSSPEMSAMFKMVMVDLLAHTGEVLGALPGDTGTLMEVIIKDRNAVVVEDLQKIMAEEKDVKTVGIIYGAGHLPDLEGRIRKLGFEDDGVRWVTAIEVDVRDTGMTTGQVRQLRESMRRSIEAQLKAAAKKSKRK
ncbi:MAG: type II secretion system protein GspG [Phycisphaeraceae bacterium]|nr:type II secretion system protein GspG [Phycisphaeraceae bacterium]